jgi:hypothetical protein
MNKKMFLKRNKYSVYLNDKLMFCGYVEDCASYLNIKIDSVYRKASRTKHNKHKSKINVYIVEG